MSKIKMAALPTAVKSKRRICTPAFLQPFASANCSDHSFLLHEPKHEVLNSQPAYKLPAFMPSVIWTLL